MATLSILSQLLQRRAPAQDRCPAAECCQATFNSFPVAAGVRVLRQAGGARLSFQFFPSCCRAAIPDGDLKPGECLSILSQLLLASEVLPLLRRRGGGERLSILSQLLQKKRLAKFLPPEVLTFNSFPVAA